MRAGHQKSSATREFYLTKMSGLARPVYIIAAKRTAFGAFGGKLKGVTATVLGQHAAEAAMAAGKVDPAIVDSSVFGNVIQVGLCMHLYTHWKMCFFWLLVIFFGFETSLAGPSRLKFVSHDL